MSATHDCTRCARRKPQVGAHGRVDLIECRASPDATVVLQALDEFRRHGEVREPFRVVGDRRARHIAWPLLFEPAAITTCEGHLPDATSLQPSESAP
jgi:hypothetical protein